MCGRVVRRDFDGVYGAAVLSAAAPTKTWTVLITTRRANWPPGYSDVLDACSPMMDGRDYPLGIVKGTPILLSSNGELDEWLVLYFNFCPPKFTSLDLSSQKTYAREIAKWCGFRGSQDDPLTWLEATEDDFIDYKIRRTDHLHFADSVAGATWNKAVFALGCLYDWAVSRKVPITLRGPVIEASPVPGGRNGSCPRSAASRRTSAPSAPTIGGRLPTGDGRPLRGLQRDHRGDDHGRCLNRRLGQDVSPKPTVHHPESSHRPIRLAQVDSAP
jgi:hypothetical protein